MHIIIENALRQANKVLLVTFGEPRVGDPLFAQRIDGMIPLQHFTYRVVHRNDLVVGVPPAELLASKPFRHHMTEVHFYSPLFDSKCSLLNPYIWHINRT